ncbi:hypothetical protein AIOL_004385 [Candidatus Rhodobacter oscarellae]|uniref:DUF4331 domain-containing protein n=1 Tax=Candidatus Rhodobacter oscarellae TaxID=1675527 RepID=A0A0J9H0Y1_9RHOB|nr:DUF4331 domain-containing protein [Candidatus Rhodobacter lobularis]KMW59403.1 hypothetical protein AIOL_004385 [Candidatus Rhodobacter lobularis]
MKIKTALVLSTALVAVTWTLAGPAPASSHREAPAITEHPKVDGTDFYMFRSYEPGREGYVTLLANYQPLQVNYGGPSYYTMDADAVYEVHIDNDGDAIEDLTFQFDFENQLANGGAGIGLDIGGENVAIPLKYAGPILANDQSLLNESETYSLTLVEGDRRSGDRSALTQSGSGNATFTKPLDHVGLKTLPDYDAYADQYIYDFDMAECDMPGRVFVGQRAEAFAINLGEIFDLINLIPIEADSAPGAGDGGGFVGGITQSRVNDDVFGKLNVTTLALELPIHCITEDDDPVIGAWTTSSLPQGELENPSPSYEDTSRVGGALVQQSRVSIPLVNEVVIGIPDKDRFNGSEPIDDGGFATYVTNPSFPRLVEILFGPRLGAENNLAPTNLPRTDLVATFLTGLPGLNQPQEVVASEMMRLNTAVPATPRDQQSTFGVVAEDLAGFPNGRRPGDDVVDIVLRVAMGALCHPVPLGAELGVDGAVEDTATDLVNLGFCTPEQAPAGTVALTDGAPLSATEMQNAFPYLNSPVPGSPNGTVSVVN